jgi:hypothetical protein
VIRYFLHVASPLAVSGLAICVAEAALVRGGVALASTPPGRLSTQRRAGLAVNVAAVARRADADVRAAGSTGITAVRGHDARVPTAGDWTTGTSRAMVEMDPSRA